MAGNEPMVANSLRIDTHAHTHTHSLICLWERKSRNNENWFILQFRMKYWILPETGQTFWAAINHTIEWNCFPFLRASIHLFESIAIPMSVSQSNRKVLSSAVQLNANDANKSAIRNPPTDGHYNGHVTKSAFVPLLNARSFARESNGTPKTLYRIFGPSIVLSLSNHCHFYVGIIHFIT